MLLSITVSFLSTLAEPRDCGRTLFILVEFFYDGKVRRDERIFNDRAEIYITEHLKHIGGMESKP